ncbi:MAG: DNA-3-methyladenine glycosylase 2 family protein [Acidimicrobiia bacterium]
MLAGLAERNGVPPLWSREPGFTTLLRLVLEQQVSLASADAAFRKLKDSVEVLEPAPFLEFDDEQLKRFGFSRQKIGYSRGIAAGLIEGSIDLELLADLPDEDAMSHLMAIRGIGPWTAACYLLFALCRPDVWPPGDRALEVAVGRAYGLPDPAVSEEANERALAWSPFRAVAARLLWHEYLGGRG